MTFGLEHIKITEDTPEILTLTGINRCTAARLALAAGSLHGAIVANGMRMDAGNVGVTVSKALGGLAGEILELFNMQHTVMSDKTDTTLVTINYTSLRSSFLHPSICVRTQIV